MKYLHLNFGDIKQCSHNVTSFWQMSEFRLFCVNCLSFGLFCSAKYKVSKDSLVEHQITGIMAMKCKWNSVFITMVVEDTIVLNPGCGPWVPQQFWAIVTDIRLLSRKVLSKVKRFKGLKYMKKFDFWHYKWIFWFLTKVKGLECGLLLCKMKSEFVLS